MTVDCFLDTNVLVYAVSGAPSEADKKARARELIARRQFGTSGQVLQEFFVTVTRKIKQPLSIERAIEVIDAFDDLPCVPIDPRLVREGALRAQRHQISYWDGAIVAAAERLGAAVLYSEDLNDDQAYGSVRVVNPFRSHS
ncbi:MAG: PIN domain-containing protein [Methylorubrum populi]